LQQREWYEPLLLFAVAALLLAAVLLAAVLLTAALFFALALLALIVLAAVWVVVGNGGNISDNVSGCLSWQGHGEGAIQKQLVYRALVYRVLASIY
jgi:hypothetical protein